MAKEKVVIGMSGGVDSSVGAYLLKEAGYDVIGVTMQIWQQEDSCTIEENGGCCGYSAIEDARRVADALSIPYYVMNFRREFKQNVMDYFVQEYMEGRTPNPCIACNRYVKWESLLKRSMDIGAAYIATGHYANVVRLDNGRFTLKKSKTLTKDQTYALYNLTQFQLSHTLMPVGEYTKEEIRSTAKEIGLKVAGKKDSQEICFIPDHNHGKFIEEYTGAQAQSGNFVTQEGKVLGKHKGIYYYTIGQRKGLNLSLGKPVFVTQIRPETNEVVIGDHEEVFYSRLYANCLNFMTIELLEGSMEVTAKIRYNHAGDPAVIRMVSMDTLECVFQNPQRAITPGQAVVFYSGDCVVGGGVILGKEMGNDSLI